MNSTFPTSRILLVAGPRTSAGLGQTPVRRYRLARVRACARPGEIAAAHPAAKRA